MITKTEERGRLLKALRHLLDMKQAEAAQRIGLSEKTLISAERGRRCSEKSWVAALEFYERRGLAVDLKNKTGAIHWIRPKIADD